MGGKRQAIGAAPEQVERSGPEGREKEEAMSSSGSGLPRAQTQGPCITPRPGHRCPAQRVAGGDRGGLLGDPSGQGDVYNWEVAIFRPNTYHEGSYFKARLKFPDYYLTPATTAGLSFPDQGDIYRDIYKTVTCASPGSTHRVGWGAPGGQLPSKHRNRTWASRPPSCASPPSSTTRHLLTSCHDV